MSREVQVSVGGVYDRGYHVAWCPKYRRPVPAGRCKELIRASAGEHSWRIVALEITPDQMRLFVKAHPSDSPPRIANQFKGLTSRRLRAEFPHLRFCLSTLWTRLYSAATAGAIPAETVRRYIGTQHGPRWRTERAW